jgi:hypothetical protein
MRLFGRGGRGARAETPAPASRPLADGDEAQLLVGRYLTDGRTLFRVQHAIPGDDGEDPLLELEDCRTLELILCSRRALERLGLREVDAGQPRGPGGRTRAGRLAGRR